MSRDPYRPDRPQPTSKPWPEWWLRICDEYGQDPEDPDAFCTWRPEKLAEAIITAMRADA